MFTGLVEACGLVREIVPDGDAVRLVVDASSLPGDEPPEIGESIAVNGCCLTVVAFDGPLRTFEAGDETLAKTNLGKLSAGDPVNLERALAANARLGGHIVQGHVDGVGHVDRIDEKGDWIDMWFRVPAELASTMVPKGSVTVDGVSLTLVNVEPERFSIALIPHTLEVTTLGRRAVGDAVNVETDVIGKYITKQLEPYLEALRRQGPEGDR